MGGRGRGRGRPMGPMPGDGKEVITLVLQPPMTYPTLEYKPLPMEITPELNYLYTCKKAFADYMEDSPNKVVPVAIKKDIERYSDQYQKEFNKTTSYHKLYDWSRMPAELRPAKKKRVIKKDEKDQPSKKKLKKEVDINSKLTELEKKESTQHSDAEDDDKDDDEDKEKEADEDTEQIEDGEEIDEEMDEGTDYVNSYFDNGENYGEDDDDDLDGDPTF